MEQTMLLSKPHFTASTFVYTNIAELPILSGLC